MHPYKSTYKSIKTKKNRFHMLYLGEFQNQKLPYTHFPCFDRRDCPKLCLENNPKGNLHKKTVFLGSGESGKT